MRYGTNLLKVVTILEKIFSKPGKVKYGNIHLLAILAGALYRYHQDFVINIIDNVLEYIVLGLEQNDFKFNQRRIAEVKYLAELYNFRMLDHPVIFDTLYRIMTFGHGGPPMPGRINPLDMPDDFFRIRLVATLLETCGIFFNRGVAGKKLDYFLSFFQYYIYTKDPLPMDIEFIVQDVFALTRPQWKLASNLEEASRAFQLAMAQDQKTAGIDRTAEPEDADSDGLSEDGIGDAEADIEVGTGDAEPEDESDLESEIDVRYFNMNSTGCNLLTLEQADSIGDAVTSAPGTDSEEESIVVTRQEEEVDPEDEADFEREYAKMMAESLESRKHERKAAFDVPLPMRRKEAATSGESWAEESAVPSTAPTGTMAFSLLTKRGNRQQVSL